MRYRSSIGVIQTLKEWEEEAIEFYTSIDIPLPKDWFIRWTKILGLELID